MGCCESKSNENINNINLDGSKKADKVADNNDSPNKNDISNVITSFLIHIKENITITIKK